MKNKYLIPLFLLFALITACSEVIDIKVDEKEKNIVLNSVISDQEEIKVNLTKSIGILESDKKVALIEDATVELFENDIFIEKMNYANGYYFSSLIPQTGTKYTIKANNNVLKPVEATTYMANKTNIKRINYSIDSTWRTEQWYDTLTQTFYDTIIVSYEEVKILVEITDNPQTNDAYMLTLAAKRPNYVYPPPDYLPVKVGDTLVTIYYNSLNKEAMEWVNINQNMYGGAIADNFFSGQTFTFSALIYAWDIKDYQNNTTMPLYINIVNLSDDLYKYVTSKNKYDEASYNPLAEPVNIFSNVKNGFGIFASYSVITDSLLIK